MVCVYRCSSEATLPKYSTQYASCFDIAACLIPGAKIQARYPVEIPLIGASAESSDDIVVTDDLIIQIPPYGRALIPTGLKFSIPPSCSIRLHPRSGASFKKGAMLANCEGVIDEDYVDEVFVPIFNTSTVPLVITHRERICQAELVRDFRSKIVETFEDLKQKGDRMGGFGSTGS